MPRYATVANQLRHLRGCRPTPPGHPFHDLPSLPSPPIESSGARAREVRPTLDSAAASVVTPPVEAPVALTLESAPTIGPPPVVVGARLIRKMAPPCRDQGAEGSCVPFGLAGAVEYLERQGGGDRLISPRWISKIGREREGTPLTEDSGMTIGDALLGLFAVGACFESTWPYIAGALADPPPGTAAEEAVTHKVVTAYHVHGLDGVKQSILEGYPVVDAMAVPANMLSDACAASGEVHVPAQGEGVEGYHCTLTMGFDDKRVIGEDVGAMLKLNSWGTGWGQQGFFWVPYRFYQAGLVDEMVTVRRVAGIG